MTPLQRYQSDLSKHDFFYDKAQEQAVKHLQRLYDDLVSAPKKSSFKQIFTKKTQIKGLYFWGGVGRGKTYLMDNFYASLPFTNKMRTHFHRFMKMIHEQLMRLKGTKNPLTVIGKKLSEQTCVICFDEFFVSDIADAMILATLLDELFKHNVTLIATSNIEPDNLYKDGLQRTRFLPAIELLKQHTEIINVDSGIDYRLRTLEQANLYYSPLDANAQYNLEQIFTNLIPENCPVITNHNLTIEKRPITALKTAGDIAWFEFNQLCDGPRSQNDYIELSKIFTVIVLSNVMQMNAGTDNKARRFINLVDEFYDQNVKLIISAQVPLTNLYCGSKLKFEFERTLSRLLEMQSHEFLAKKHLG